MKFALHARHSNAAQCGVVLEGEMELTVEGKPRVLRRGDTYYLPAGVRHSSRISKGDTDLTLFDQKDRFRALEAPR